MSRRTRIAVHDPAPITPAAVAPLTESSADVWRRWGQDRQEREIWKLVASETHNQALTGPIYPRELAEAIAKATAKMVPDWRLLKTEHPAWSRKLAAQQPEMQIREVQQYSPLVQMITSNLPGHIRPLVADLEAIVELRAVAREAAAFLIGCEVGRQQQQMYVDARGRLVKRHDPRPESQNSTDPSPFRLHLG